MLHMLLPVKHHYSIVDPKLQHYYHQQMIQLQFEPMQHYYFLF